MPEVTAEMTSARELTDQRQGGVIRQNQLVPEDAWQVVRLDEDGNLPSYQQPALLPLAHWQALVDAGEVADQLGPWLASDTELTPELGEALATAPLLAVDFPNFNDGRGYTLARLMRERYGFQGEIRAIGDVLVDQLHYMSRCGIDAFQLRSDQYVEDALYALSIFSVSYQTGIDQTSPLFSRRW
ncbi:MULTISPECIES: DUF934 domain-containing protein [Cobetia]|uniref:DUF934 domain-containing protein n=2 Tax=Gammaproteobacteria TaxID=1236 RepID=UPI000986616E|nr:MULTISPECIES: DUF934 domain-containing protein [Cobetia]